MTVTRSAAAGALVLNLPTLFAAAALPAAAVAISAFALAAVGAALGALTRWAISHRIDEAVAASTGASGIERLAA
jgi:membrane protein YqaA with SNARE-associated domain